MICSYHASVRVSGRLGQVPRACSRAAQLLAAVLVAAAPISPARAGTAVVIDAHEFPFSAIGRLNIGGRGRCTAALIGPRHALTAAHCLYNPNTRDFWKPFEVRFLPAYQRGDYRLSARAVRFITPEHYRFAWHPPPADVALDWAVIELDKPLGEIAGYLGTEVLTPAQVGQARTRGALFFMAGYRKRLGEVQSLQIVCRVLGVFKAKDKAKSETPGKFVDALGHDCESTGGESGGPLLLLDRRGLRIVAVQSITYPLKDGIVTVAAMLAAMRDPAVAGAAAAVLERLGILGRATTGPKPGGWIALAPVKSLAALRKAAPEARRLADLLRDAAAMAKRQ